MELIIGVESKVTIADLLLRFLQLEQRIESYAALYEEEMAEIKDTIQKFREDILQVSRNLAEELPVGRMVDDSQGDPNDFVDDLSL
jgi:hypothetical protein